MSCSNCGFEITTGAKFCPECGARQATSCPSCGTPSAPGAKFCAECGTPMGASAARPVTAPPHAPSAADEPVTDGAGPARLGAVAERRVVTVLFADLVGFTTYAEGRDAEDVRESLSAYFDLTRGVIERHGGVVEKFIGDAVMAVWGAPVAHEDDAERAVRTGLELVAAIRALGPGTMARVGILTGEAAVTLGATNQGMVAGDLVNTAARLQSIAEPGTVLVGEPTARAAAAAIAFEPIGEQQLKGKAMPVPALRALRVIAERGGRRRTDVLEAPFVGRDDELRLIKDLFHATQREGRARLVSVIGPAGIGKSRLAWEFEKYLDGIVDTVWWHHGRAPAYGDGMTFWSLGEMVRGRLGLAETDDERTGRRQIADALARFVPDEAERRWIEPALLALLGIEAGSGAPEQLFAAWRTFFERLSATGTVVFVFEDLHWADAGTLDFIDHMLEWSRNVPFYLVTLARPELTTRRPDWGAGKRNFTSIYLEPLSEPSMRQLLAGLVPGLPESTVRTIIGRADGMPLYAVETIRMLVADRRLVQEGDRYVPIGDLTTLAIPDTLTALIGARLDSLAAADRALLQDASVLGQSFTPIALATVAGQEVAAVEARLRTLVRVEMVTHEVDPRSPERGQYAFVQALLREVTYNTLAKRDRKVRHLAAARYFESLDSDELAGALATHFLDAFRNADGAEAEALAAQARLALVGAAGRAAALGSKEQAAGLYLQAIAVSRDPREELDLLAQAGLALVGAGRYDDAIAHLQRAHGLAGQAGGTADRIRAGTALGRALVAARRSSEGAAVLEPLAAELAEAPDVPAIVAVSLLVSLGGTRMRMENPAGAIELAERALQLAEANQLFDGLAEALTMKGTALAAIGRRIEGLGLMQLGGEVADRHGFPLIALRALGNRGAYLLDDPRAALEAERQAITMARRLGERPLLVINVMNAMEDAFRLGEWDWGVAQVRAELTGDLAPLDRAQMLAGLIQVAAFRGEPVDAMRQEMSDLVAGNDDPMIVSSVTSLEAMHALARGDFPEARRQARITSEASALNAPLFCLIAARAAVWDRDPTEAARDLADLEATGARGAAMEIGRTTTLAAIAALEGRPDDARAGFREAIRGWRTLGLDWDEALTAIDMATVLDPADADVQEAVQRARLVFDRLGAVPMLRRLDTLVGQLQPRDRDAAGRATSTERSARVDA